MLAFSLQLACIGIFTSISIVTSESGQNDIALKKRDVHFSLLQATDAALVKIDSVGC